MEVNTSISTGLSTEEYQTKSQLVLRRLRKAIISGELSPGQKIPQDQIALELNISRIPLREALQKLEEQGFITIIPHHGAVVNKLSADEIKELYLIRLQLELLAARAAAERIDDVQLKALRRILDDAYVALEKHDHERIAVLNQQFHQAAYEASGYQRLCRLISDLRVKCERYRLLHTNLAARAAVALQEHEAMLRAWESRDPDAAEIATRINMANSAKALLEAIEPEVELDWSQKTFAHLPALADIS